jgi:hypothetical protein
MNWQPIETAPKDGTALLVINGPKGGYYTESFQIGIARWSRAYGHKSDEWLSTVCCDGVSAFEPTHWMPLPEPPQ